MVSRLASAATLVASALLLFACTEDKGSLPTEALPQVSLLVVPGSPCDIKQVKSTANSVYPSKQSTQITELLKQLATGSNAAAFKLMDLLSQDVKLGTLAKTATPSLESDLVIGITNCGTGLVFPSDVTELSRAFQDNGVFEVRGLNSTGAEAAVFARNGGFSAIEAPGGNFYSWFGGTGAVFGWPLATEFRTETRAGQGYEYFLIRATSAALNGKGFVGLCVDPTNNPEYRVQHAGSVSAFVNPSTAIPGWSTFSSNCPDLTPPSTLSAILFNATPLAFLRSAAEYGFRLVQPEPLSAYTGRTGSGSGSGSVSPFGVVDAGSINLSFTCPTECKTPADGPVGTLSPQPVVKATGANGTPIEGVSVTLSVAGNSGSFHFCGVKTQPTDVNGLATFSGLVLDKAGGYTITAVSNYNGYDASTVNTTLFNLSGSTAACTP